jgi:Kef-type K+ transport system membrane component KefB
VRKTTNRGRQRRFMRPAAWLLLAVLAVLAYQESIPPWVWTFVAAVVVVAVVYYWLGFLRGRRR